jgi:hypothetical protein
MHAREQEVAGPFRYDGRASFAGIRFGLRGGALFLRGQYMAGTLPAMPGVAVRDLRMAEVGGGFFLAPEFRLDGAVFGREYVGGSATERRYGAKVGLGVQGALWPDLVEVRAAGHYIPLVKSTATEERVDVAWDGEVELAIRPRIPVRAFVMYRVERLDTAEPTALPSDGPVRQLRTSGLVFGVQLSL